MNFELTEDQAMVRDMARELAENELLPRARKHDDQGFIDPEVFTLLGEAGMWGLTIPEEYGGSGMSNVVLCLVLEEINRACAATGVTIGCERRGRRSCRTTVSASR